MLFYINHKNIFFGSVPWSEGNKSKNKQSLIQVKNLLHSKGSHQQMRRQPTEWEEIFPNDMTDRGLYPIYINSPYNSTSRKQETQLKYEQKIWIDIFPKRKCKQQTVIWKDAQYH